MRRALGAAIAARRAYRRSAEYRQAAVEASWVRLAERSRADASAEFPGRASRSRIQRSLSASGVTAALVTVGLVAGFLGASALGQRAQPVVLYSPIDPHFGTPAASGHAAPIANGATGPARVTPWPDSSAADGPSGTAPATGSPAVAGAPVVSSTPAAAVTPSVSGSPSLVDLCRVVVNAGNSWPSVVTDDDRARLVAAAGKQANVLPYCTALTA